MINIAILLTGHVRTYQQTFQSFFSNIINLNNVKIFCHCWNTIGHIASCWWSKNGDGNQSEIDKLDIKNKYNPAKILIEEQKNFISQNKFYNEVGGYSAVHSQWLSIYQAYKLMEEYEKENDMRFDVVLKTRYDIFYENIISNIELQEAMCSYIYFLPTPHSKTCKLYSDIIFFCNRNIFSKIIDFNNVMDNYFDEAIKYHKVIEGEQPFTKYIKNNNNFNCEIKYSSLKTWIYRLNGDKIILF